jgi:hypothetical protein
LGGVDRANGANREGWEGWECWADWAAWADWVDWVDMGDWVDWVIDGLGDKRARRVEVIGGPNGLDDAGNAVNAPDRRRLHERDMGLPMLTRARLDHPSRPDEPR